jgi:hypothetical protein
VEVVTGQLAPDPPCERGLTVVGGGCWGAVSSTSSPRTWHCKQNPPYERLLIDVGAVSLVVGTIGHRCRRSTRDPPHEQLLVRLGAGSASSVTVVAGTGVPRSSCSCGGDIIAHPCSTPRAVAREAETGHHWVVVSWSHPRSTLRAVARKAGRG